VRANTQHAAAIRVQLEVALTPGEKTPRIQKTRRMNRLNWSDLPQHMIEDLLTNP
jgi:hypothetical protein